MATETNGAASGVVIGRELGFPLCVATIIALLFVPLPPVLIDLGLALSIAAAILILMVSLWIERPLEFSAFPTILLIVTMMRLGLKEPLNNPANMAH